MNPRQSSWPSSMPRSARVVNVIDGVLWLALIYVMVAKPFS